MLRTLPASTSRRGVLFSLSGGLVAALPVFFGNELVEAKKRRKRKKQSTTPQVPTTPVTRAVRPDATCPGTVNTGFFSDNPNARLAETFTPIASGPLVHAQLDVDKLPGTLGDYLLGLSPVDGAGFPTNIVQ